MQKENAVIKRRRHPELDSGSSTHDVSQRQQPRQAWKIPNQVWNDNTNFMSGLHPTYNGNGFTPSLVIAQSCSAQYSEGRKSGFTLIELLVVVLIIGILAAVALPQYQKAVEKARATEGLTMLKSIATANKAYYMANGEYATDIEALDIEVPGENTTVDPTTRRNTKLFQYGTSSVSGGQANTNVIALAIRKENDVALYRLYFYRQQDTVCCYGVTQKGKDICKSMAQGKTNSSKEHSSYGACYQL